MNKKVVVFSGAPAVGKTTYMKRKGLKSTKPELADNPELLERFKPYLIDKSKLTFEIQQQLSSELIDLALKHIEIDEYLDRIFLDGLALAFMQFIYYKKPSDIIQILDYIENLSQRDNMKELKDKVEYVIFITSWENNLERLKKRGRDIDAQDMGWYEFCNRNFLSYMTFVLNKFGISYRVEVL